MFEETYLLIFIRQAEPTYQRQRGPPRRVSLQDLRRDCWQRDQNEIESEQQPTLRQATDLEREETAIVVEHGDGGDLHGGEESHGVRESRSSTVHHGQTLGARAADVQDGLDAVPRGLQRRAPRLRRPRDRVALLGRYQVKE